MRRELFYKPHLLVERVGQALIKRQRLRRLRGTCAAALTPDHIDSMELIDLAAAEGARVFYDVGANVGTWTQLCRALVPDSVIVAFEPMDEHLEGFRRNTAGLDRVSFFPLALGAREETRTFYPASFSDASGFLPLNEEGRARWLIANETPRNMSLLPLDQVIESQSLLHPDLIKLDVQGFEIEVLRGAGSALQHARWIISEVSFEEYYAGQCLFSHVAAFLSGAGYEVHALAQRTPTAKRLTQTDVLFRRA